MSGIEHRNRQWAAISSQSLRSEADTRQNVCWRGWPSAGIGRHLHLANDLLADSWPATDHDSALRFLLSGRSMPW